MKKYIIFTHTIYNLGGGQYLTLRKIKILEDLGYQVLVIFKKRRGPFILEEQFENIPYLYVPDFGLPLNLVSSESHNECIQRVLDFIGEVSDDSIIESNDIPTAVWAELVAQKIGIRHIYYLIIETSFSSYKFYPYKDFFEFKLQRNEIWACNSKGLDISFNRPLPKYSDNYINVPYDISEISEVSHPIINFGNWKCNNKYVISTISRLDKKYVIDLFKAVKDICISNPNLNIELIIVGDTVVGKNKEWLKDNWEQSKKNLTNMNVIMPGYISTIGKDLFLRTNLFVGMGTAIISSISQGCISLAVNPYTSLTSGVFGIETNNFAFNDNGIELNLKDKIYSVLQDKNISSYKKELEIFFTQNYSIDAYKYKYLQLISRCEEKIQFYNFDSRSKFKIFDKVINFCYYIKTKIL